MDEDPNPSLLLLKETRMIKEILNLRLQSSAYSKNSENHMEKELGFCPQNFAYVLQVNAPCRPSRPVQLLTSLSCLHMFVTNTTRVLERVLTEAHSSDSVSSGTKELGKAHFINILLSIQLFKNISYNRNSIHHAATLS